MKMNSLMIFMILLAMLPHLLDEKDYLPSKGFWPKNDTNVHGCDV